MEEQVRHLRAGGLVHVHRPGRVHRHPAVVEGDATPVLLGVQVRAELAAPQPHVLAVVELLHGSLELDRCGGEGVGSARRDG